MSHHDLLNLLTASDFASLDDAVPSDSTALLNSAAPLNNTVYLDDAAPLSDAADYSRLSFLILFDRLASFVLFDDKDNCRTE